MDNVIKVAKSLEDPGQLLKGVAKTVESKTK